MSKQSYRDKQQEEKEVDNYTTNLTLHYEAKKSELKQILRVSIPHQVNKMKTIMWINIILIGFTLQFLNPSNTQKILTLFTIELPSISLMFSIISIFFVFLAMIIHRAKNYGVLDDITHMSRL